jgi:GxxExxY protein
MSEVSALSKKVVGLAMKVHSVLGPGFLESVYQNALLIELRRAGLVAEAGKEIAVHYCGEIVGRFVADIFVRDPANDEQLLIENKAVSALAVAHSVQLVNYLTATQFDQGLLLNFGGSSLEFKTKHRRSLGSQPLPDLHS